MHVLKVYKTQSGTACFVCSCGKAIATTRLDWLDHEATKEEIWAQIIHDHRKHRGDCVDVRYPMMYPVWVKRPKSEG